MIQCPTSQHNVNTVGVQESWSNARQPRVMKFGRVWRRRHSAVAFMLGSAAMFLLPALLHETERSQHIGTGVGGADDPAAHEPLPPIAHLRSVEHLIVVAGHAVYTASDRSNGQVQREASWFLEPFQKGEQRPRPQSPSQLTRSIGPGI